MPMKLKLDENGNAVLVEQDGKKMPVYVYDDGKEAPFDADASIAKIHQLNGEAKSHREAKEALEAKLKPFLDAGIEDPEAAKKALEMVENLDSGKLLTAGKVEEIKAAARKAAEDQLAAASKAHAEELSRRDEEIKRLTTTLHNELIGGSFNRSKLIQEKFAIPADLVQAKFGSQFKVEDGKIVAYDKDGNKIFSRSKPGDLADFEEALETIVGQYPHKDQILKGEVKPGSGAGQSGGAGGGGLIFNKRAQDMSPAEKAQFIAERGLDAWSEKIASDYKPT